MRTYTRTTGTICARRNPKSATRTLDATTIVTMKPTSPCNVTADHPTVIMAGTAVASPAAPTAKSSTAASALG